MFQPRLSRLVGSFKGSKKPIASESFPDARSFFVRVILFQAKLPSPGGRSARASTWLVKRLLLLLRAAPVVIYVL